MYIFHCLLHFQHLISILNLGFGADSEEDKHFSLGFKITKYGCNCRVKNTCPLYTLDLRIVMVPDDCIIA